MDPSSYRAVVAPGGGLGPSPYTKPVPEISLDIGDKGDGTGCKHWL